MGGGPRPVAVLIAAKSGSSEGVYLERYPAAPCVPKVGSERIFFLGFEKRPFDHLELIKANSRDDSLENGGFLGVFWFEKKRRGGSCHLGGSWCVEEMMASVICVREIWRLLFGKNRWLFLVTFRKE